MLYLAFLQYDTQVNERYINKLRPRPNESDFEYRMTEKNIKELKVTTYTNKVHLPYQWFNHKNVMIKHVSLRTILCS